jgi:hypothetical protein
MSVDCCVLGSGMVGMITSSVLYPVERLKCLVLFVTVDQQFVEIPSRSKWTSADELMESIMLNLKPLEWPS